jgi:hypothetical protein
MRDDDLSPELPERIEEIRGTPPLGHPAAGEPHDVERGDLDLPDGRPNSQEPVALGASPDDVSRHEVAPGQDDLDAAADVRERLPHGGRPLLEADYAGRLAGHGVWSIRSRASRTSSAARSPTPTAATTAR